MISDSADKSQMGKAFGIHKALDMMGSAIGFLLAFLLLKQMGENSYKMVFGISIIPILIALTMFFFVEEKKEEKVVIHRERFWENMTNLSGNLKLYLVVAFIFTLGNSSNTFLLLKATAVGFSNTDVILLYFIYNITAAILAIQFGKSSDKSGRKIMLIIGYVTFALVYFMFAFATQ